MSAEMRVLAMSYGPIDLREPVVELLGRLYGLLRVQGMTGKLASESGNWR